MDHILRESTSARRTSALVANGILLFGAQAGEPRVVVLGHGEIIVENWGGMPAGVA